MSSRRKFIQATSLMGLGIFSISEALSSDNPILNLNEFETILHEGDGETYYIGNRKGKVTIKIDKLNKGIKSMSLCLEEIPKEDGIPIHKHLNEDEFIFIHEGRGILTFGDHEYEVNKGSLAFVPKGKWHGLRNEHDQPIKMFFGYSPAGFENYFREIGVKDPSEENMLTAEDWARINNKHHVVYK